MSSTVYDEYQETGVAWLGKVPAHWDVLPYKRMIDIQNGSDHKHIEQDEGYPVIGSGGIFAYASEFMYDGESVLLGRKGTIDKPLYVTGKFWTVDTMYWSKISPDACGRFVYYSALTIPFDLYSTSTALPSMTKGALNAHRIAVPPLEEQKAIASFLDSETSNIDALVAEQRRLIELLKEKRQAVISHAVTKGLNPNAPMKPSGIQWLGDVPEHWDTTRLKHATSHIVDCPHETPTLTADGDYLSIRTADIDDGKIYPDQMRRVDEKEYLNRIRREPVLRNDIVYSREGGRWGHGALVPESDLFCLGQRMMQFRANQGFDPRYLMWHLNAKNVYRQGDVDTVGAASPHVNVETICNYQIAEPPKEEQEQIADFLEDRTGRFDALIAEAEQAIELLQERRTALISAAVTGKIDVREFAYQETA